MKKCIICGKKDFKAIWYGKLRNSSKGFTTKKEKIYQCLQCDLGFLKNRRKKLEDSSVTRNLFNKNNSYKEFVKFHSPREKAKLKFIEKYISFKNKKILESNCGTAILLNKLNRISKQTVGLDSPFYKKIVEKNGHKFYSNIDEIIKDKIKFDVILSLSEIEHKFNPVSFIKKIKRVLSKKGVIIFRIPNFNNIYMYTLGYNFFKYDYRISHNFYFGEKNLDMLFKKLNLEIVKKVGFNEYSFNHLLNYINVKKRVPAKGLKKYFNIKTEMFVKKNIENSLAATSLIYILK